MSKTNKIFEAIPVQIPDRSGFDLSHEVLTTSRVGTITPITSFEVLPGDTISMGSVMKVTMPPFAVPFMGRVDAALEAFFVPNRLLWQGWQSFITQNVGVQNPTPAMLEDLALYLPHFLPDYEQNAYFGPGTLTHYLGYKGDNRYNGPISAMKHLAYHKICDDWYRDENNMKPFFPKVVNYPGNHTAPGSVGYPGIENGRYLPHMGSIQSATPNIFNTRCQLNPVVTSDESPADLTIGLGDLRQRCWSKDYFTTATTRPQAGPDSSVSFIAPVSEDPDNPGTQIASGAFTVAQLRASNALQKWLEKQNIAGTNYGSMLLAHFGCLPPDAVLDRSVLLGQVRTPVIVGSVDNNSNAEAQATKNPYGSTLGSAAGFGSGLDKGSLIDEFTAKEHGYIMVMFTLIPHVYYNAGVDRELFHVEFGDFAWPEFAGIGDQPIYQGEISGNGYAYKSTWGYQQRFCEYKHRLDVVTGWLSAATDRAGTGIPDISVYALQRNFETVPELGKSFLTIPPTYLDDYYAVSSNVSGFGCMVDAFFDAKALRVLPEYSLPHL